MKLALSNASAETLYHLAYRLYRQGRYKEGIPLFRVLTTLHPNTKKFWMGLGACCQMSKSYTDATVAYQKASSLDPADSKIHLYAADCFFSVDCNKEGLARLAAAEKIIRSQPKPDENLLAHITLLRNARKGR